MTIKDTSIFPLKNNKHTRIRSSHNGIILTHMIDLVDISKNTFTDIKFDISDKNQYNEHFFYFKRNLGYEQYGYHLFFETFYNEIFNYNGCNLSNRSEYLIELTQQEILNKQYQDYLLVVINGNLNYDLIEKHMYTRVAYHLAGILNYEHLELKKLKYLEDIIDKSKIKSSNFLIQPMKHFDKGLFLKELLRFKDK